MLKKIAIVLVVIVAAVLGYAATRPDTFSVERSAVIKAPPERIHALINDFQRWKVWSPWEARDPAMKRSYAGPPAGKGSVYAWEGNREVGSGRMEILESAAGRILIQLDFFTPFEGHNQAIFTLTPQDGGTRVSWTMTGPSPFIGKLMHVFIDMDAMIGKDFEAGLAKMKAIAEKT
jgi:hypothetical protein